MMRKRDRLYDKVKKTQKNVSQHNHAKTMTSRLKIQSEIRKAYWSYVESIISPMQEENTSRKRFWTFIKHRRVDNNSVGTLKENGEMISDPKDKADTLNRQFESVFTTETPLTDEIISNTRYNQTTQWPPSS